MYLRALEKKMRIDLAVADMLPSYHFRLHLVSGQTAHWTHEMT